MKGLDWVTSEVPAQVDSESVIRRLGILEAEPLSPCLHSTGVFSKHTVVYVVNAWPRPDSLGGGGQASFFGVQMLGLLGSTGMAGGAQDLRGNGCLCPLREGLVQAP